MHRSVAKTRVVSEGFRIVFGKILLLTSGSSVVPAALRVC